MKKLTILLFLFIITSCDYEKKYKETFEEKYIIRAGKSEWDWGAIRGIDSLNMKSKNHVIYWIDGRKTEIYAEWIKIMK